MMGKVSRPMLVAYSFLSTFLVIIFTLFTYFFGSNTKNWWAKLFEIRIFHVPILFHIFVLSLGLSFITFLLITVIQKAQYGKIEEKLRLLANNDYESKKLEQPVPYPSNDLYIQEVDKDILKIKDKMMEMSKELQLLNSRPQIMDGETKEEILQLERHRLARELHDSVSQQLFAAMMLMSALNEQAQKLDALEAYRKQLAMVADIINASQSEMRALLLHLRPISLEGKSLKQGIEQLLVELKSKIQIKLKWDVEDVTLNSSMEDHLFRVVQELLSNTLRHAKADELEVYLHQVDQSVLLRAVDDGVGFDMNQSKTGSYGLTNIRERVTGMGGTVKIISFVGKGTSVEIKIPLFKEVEKND
ncbi:two-component sensor histidine kinase [Enterococcus sp. JM4C]|uniref:sensor histidine kinase n=1 Tax=Candidatus Enterococcus huntleyi TaxID=1857217 RepID=UPI00137A502C|nr:sensor histidine kinase [Enterococcus sp. JM4C]KAF1297237.1 two-component sensor histidine kinase [Enterococcus sp. JM4C]